MYYSLQIGRGIAAIMVVLTHIAGPMSNSKYFGISIFDKLFSFGTFGVQYFFVLSGFIIYHVHKNELSTPSALVPYIKKRFLRIYPTFIVIFLLVYFLGLLTSQESILQLDLISIIKSIILISSFPVPVIGVAWTLEYEIFFYLLFALLIINKKFIYLICAIFIFSHIYNYSDNISFLYLGFLQSSIMLLFFMGLFVAYIIKIRIDIKIVYTILILGILIFFSEIYNSIINYNNNHNSYQNLILGLAFSLIVFSFVKIEQYGYDFKKFKIMNLLGDASYSIYLLHYPISLVVVKVAFILNLDKINFIGPSIVFVTMLCLSIVFSVLFHLRIEKPMLKYIKNKFIGNERLNK